ncbi:hypothetical protein LCGC14_1069260 [marine sediment metagenome]|uniref:Uncharacterized protein n=1 Tax=marine sediment metagenome TaxID=412755 RepID=A0A0F9MNL1_9ZZZZ
MQDPLQQWSRQLPTEPGYYWWWEIGAAEAEIVQVIEEDIYDGLHVWMLGHHYVDCFVVPLELIVFVYDKDGAWAPANDTHPPLLEMWVQP